MNFRPHFFSYKYIKFCLVLLYIIVSQSAEQCGVCGAVVEECGECCCVSLQGSVSAGGEERLDQLPPAMGGRDMTHATGVLVTPSMPLEAVSEGVPISGDMFQGYRVLPQQAINPPGLHQFAFPQDMPEGTTVSIIPQPGMAMGEAGQMDPSHMALGTAYVAHLGQVRGDGGQMLVEGGQPVMDHGYQDVTIPLAGSAPMCMTTPMGLAHGATQAMPTDMPPGESLSDDTLPSAVLWQHNGGCGGKASVASLAGCVTCVVLCCRNGHVWRGPPAAPGCHAGHARQLRPAQQDGPQRTQGTTAEAGARRTPHPHPPPPH